MFFRKRISVPQYCATRLGLILSKKQDDMWMDLKRNSTDIALRQAVDKAYLDNLHAAHIQLMGVAIARTYHKIEFAVEAAGSVTALLESANLKHLQEIKDAYNQAFGASRADGVLAMAHLVSARVANGKLAASTIEEIRDLFYDALGSMFGDFKQVKLVAG